MIVGLFVKAGQELTADLWNSFWAMAKRFRILPGPGILLRKTDTGTIISFDGGAAALRPHFKVTVPGMFATFRTGFVNGEEPVIEGVPLSGDAKRPAPKLQMLAVLRREPGTPGRRLGEGFHPNHIVKSG